jgi:hypothetical protein
VALFEPVFEALDRADVRFVVVGGVAVVLHGHPRLTADLDLAVDLEPEAARRAVLALSALGLRPAAPVDPEAFADPVVRARWMAERGMRVFAMRDPDDALRQVDLFVEEPIPFEELWNRSAVVPLGERSVHVASIGDLIRMKELADRPIDREDVTRLREIEASDDG